MEQWSVGAWARIWTPIRILQPAMRTSSLIVDRVPGSRLFIPPPIPSRARYRYRSRPLYVLILLVVDLLVDSGGSVLLVLLLKSHRSADRRGYKAGRFTYSASERRLRESLPVSGGGTRAALPT
jgi:hypothetical protein